MSEQGARDALSQYAGLSSDQQKFYMLSLTKRMLPMLAMFEDAALNTFQASGPFRYRPTFVGIRPDKNPDTDEFLV